MNTVNNLKSGLIIFTIVVIILLFAKNISAQICCDPNDANPCPNIPDYSYTCDVYVPTSVCASEYQCDYARTGAGGAGAVDWLLFFQSLGQNPTGFRLDEFTTFAQIINSLLDYVFPLAGLLLLIYLLYGGFQYLTSGGDPKKIESAKKILTYAITGFVIIFIAFWLVQIVSRILGIPGVAGGDPASIVCYDSDGHLSLSEQIFVDGYTCGTGTNCLPCPQRIPDVCSVGGLVERYCRNGNECANYNVPCPAPSSSCSGSYSCSR